MEKPFAITLEVESSLANHTGSWRVERPQYVNLMPPCNNACPAGENIQNWLYVAEDGSYEPLGERSSLRIHFPQSWGASAITRVKPRAIVPN
jgi:hypothetical protein